MSESMRNFNAASVYSWLIVLALVGSLVILYFLYKLLFRLKFYSGMCLVIMFMTERFTRTFSRLYVPTVETPPLIELQQNDWFRDIITSNITYVVINLLLTACLIWTLVDIEKRIRVVKTERITKEGEKEKYIADETFLDDETKKITIVKEQEKNND